MYVGMAAFRRVLRVLPHLVIAFAALAGASAAAAATIQTSLPCYLEDRQVQITGAAFNPGATYTVLRDGQAVGTGKVGSDGTVTGRLNSGKLDPGLADRSFDLAVTDGQNQAATRFRVSRFLAEFAPRRSRRPDRASGADAGLVRQHHAYAQAAAVPVPAERRALAPAGRHAQDVRRDGGPAHRSPG